MRLCFFLIAIFSLIPLSAQTEDNKLSDIAIAYMQAYSEWNPAKMQTFYNDSIHFTDPTAIEAFSPNYNLRGKDKVTKLFKSIFPDKLPDYVNFKVKNHFTSGSFVVINSTFELVLPSNWFPEAQGKIFVSVPMVTILKFKEGKILSHQDYVDYDSYNKQIQFQKG